jgi:transposase
MAASQRFITGGVDTHRDTHHAAVLDEVGWLLGDAEFPSTPDGFRALLAWMRGYGMVRVVG